MQLHFSPFMLVTAAFMGVVSAYLAAKRGKNPYLWFVLGFSFGIFGIFAIFFASMSKKAQKPLPRQPVYQLDGPSDKFWYYLDPSHTQQGPMSRDALLTAWRAGKVNLSTLIWHEELTDWKPLQESLKTETFVEG